MLQICYLKNILLYFVFIRCLFAARVLILRGVKYRVADSDLIRQIWVSLPSGISHESVIMSQNVSTVTNRA